MKQDSTYLTKEKFAELSNELEKLKTSGRKEIAEDLEYAKSLGDLSENAEYQEAREAQATIEDRINHLEAVLKSATIVSSHHTNEVTVGSKVSIKKESMSDVLQYTLVGTEEADLTKGFISYNSPLGAAVMGKKKGEDFSFKSPKGSIKYTIVDIH